MHVTFSLAVQNGDLSLLGSQLAIVSGTPKLAQDLQLWILESYGGDRFHPAMGSTLEAYIGSVINPATSVTMQNEVLRVLANYQRVQQLGFTANPQLYSLAELLYSINDVSATISYDTVTAAVSVTSAAGQQATVTASQSTT